MGLLDLERKQIYIIVQCHFMSVNPLNPTFSDSVSSLYAMLLMTQSDFSQ